MMRLFIIKVLLFVSGSLIPFTRAEAEKSIPRCPDQDKTDISSTSHAVPISVIPSDPSDEIQSNQEIAKVRHFMKIKPLLYELKLTFTEKKYSGGELKLIFQVVENTNRIYINMNMSTLRLLNSSSSIGLQELCSPSPVDKILKISLIPEDGIFIVHTTELEAGGYFELHLKFVNTFVHGQFYGFHEGSVNDSWTITSLFQIQGARTVFPCIDHPSLKASFKICIEHSGAFGAVSNMPLEHEDSSRRSIIESCFAESPPLSTYLVAISLYANMTIYNNQVRKNLNLRIIVPKEPGDEFGVTIMWVFSRAKSVLELMENYTGVPYWLPKLDIFFSIRYPSHVAALEHAGLITLRYDPSTYRGKSFFGRLHLTHEIVHQWIGNYVTTDVWNNLCLQEGLTLAISMGLYEEIDGQSRRSKFLTKVVNFLYQPDMLKADLAEEPAIFSAVSLTKVFQLCYTKPMLTFYMLKNMYGFPQVMQLARGLVQAKPFGSANWNDWLDIWKNVTQDALAISALNTWVTAFGFPVLIVKHQYLNDNEFKLRISQKIIQNNSASDALPSNFFPLPILVLGSHEEIFRGVLDQPTKELTLKAKTKWFFMDPELAPMVRIVYDSSYYLSFIECWKATASKDDPPLPCQHIESKSLFDVWGYFCWAATSGALPASISDDLQSITLDVVQSRVLLDISPVFGMSLVGCHCTLAGTMKAPTNVDMSECKN